VLVAVRGGPYAELAVRVALAATQDLPEAAVTTLHIRPPEDAARHDAPFRGIEQVLRRMPEVLHQDLFTGDPAAAILEQAANADLLVMGASARLSAGEAPLGAVTARVLQASEAGIIVVKSRRPMPAETDGPAAGAEAISILVDKWFAENTFDADEFADLGQLVALKRAQDLTISLALPALNEEETIGSILETVQQALVREAPLLDEIVLIDSNSTDRTRAIAASLGVPVHIHQELLPGHGARAGKGEALWKSLYVTRGDLLVWIDTDIVNFHPRFVYGILGPLLHNPGIQFVKGFYRRPLKVGDKVQAGGGGRVTELTARPLLNLFYPELSGVVQPLSGEYGGRRSVLEALPFFSGYGVETGLLIDVFERHGLPALAQVDLLERIHHNQSLDALSKMSFAIIQAVIRKIEGRYGLPLLDEVNKTMKLIRYDGDGYSLDVEMIAEGERPPMLYVPEYGQRKRTDDLA
jgi:glucosyl-3-phosphoglycerate synthase